GSIWGSVGRHRPHDWTAGGHQILPPPWRVRLVSPFARSGEIGVSVSRSLCRPTTGRGMGIPAPLLRDGVHRAWVARGSAFSARLFAGFAGCRAVSRDRRRITSRTWQRRTSLRSQAGEYPFGSRRKAETRGFWTVTIIA